MSTNIYQRNNLKRFKDETLTVYKEWSWDVVNGPIVSLIKTNMTPLFITGYRVIEQSLVL